MISRPIRILVAASLLCSLPAVALAQGATRAPAAPTPAPAAPAPAAPRAPDPSPGHLAAARELIQATGSLASIDQIIPALFEEVRRQGVTRPEIVKDLEEVLKALGPEMELQRQQALNIATRAYAKWLTEAEMRDIIAFFKTPAGAKYIQVQPELVDDVINQVTAWSQEASEYLMVRARVEMRKRGQDLN